MAPDRCGHQRCLWRRQLPRHPSRSLIPPILTKPLFAQLLSVSFSCLILFGAIAHFLHLSRMAEGGVVQGGVEHLVVAPDPKPQILSRPPASPLINISLQSTQNGGVWGGAFTKSQTLGRPPLNQTMLEICEKHNQRRGTRTFQSTSRDLNRLASRRRGRICPGLGEARPGRVGQGGLGWAMLGRSGLALSLGKGQAGRARSAWALWVLEVHGWTLPEMQNTRGFSPKVFTTFPMKRKTTQNYRKHIGKS